jgi:hypothetical protein
MNKFLSSIPRSRLITYALILGLVPVVLAFMHIYSKSSEAGALQERVESLTEMALLKEKKQAVNKAVMSHYQDADRFYIDKNIESITLLKPEIEALEKISRQNNFIENEEVTNRLKSLKERNALVFAEGVVQTYPQFSETAETLVHPVEVDLNDLQNLLARIEDVEIGPYKPGRNAPQLIITDFKLEKKTTTENNEVFSLNIKLLKREYVPES